MSIQTQAKPAAKAIMRRMTVDDDNRRQQSTTRSAERYTFDGGKLRFTRDTLPGLLPGVCLVPIAGVPFELRLVAGPILHPDGGTCRGLYYCDQLLILVSADIPPALRLRVAWHEIGHAIYTLNVGERDSLDEESVCDLVGLAMAGITPEKFAEITAFVLR